MVNTMMVIFPYRHNGMWVFDDDLPGRDLNAFVQKIKERAVSSSRKRSYALSAA